MSYSFFMKDTEDREELNLTATFDNLINKAAAIQEKCEDEIIIAKNMHVSDDIAINGKDITSFALGELCGKLQVPSRYIGRLITSHNGALAAENLNYWLAEDERKIMLREYDGHIRGVLSGSYSCYDSPEILQSINEVFGDRHFKLKGSFINEERLHVRLVENELLPIDGEDLYAGITLDSSDIGRSGLAVRFFVYKQVCTNGLTVAKSSARVFTQKHIGISHEDFKTGLEDGLANFSNIKNEVVGMIQETHKIPMPEDIEALSEKIKAQTKLSDDDIEEVYNLTISNYEPTMWGVINGITEIAQKFTLERRLELETVAGNLLV